MIEINGVPFAVGYNNYGYKGFFNTLLNYERGVKKTLLRNLLWIKDTAGLMENFDLNPSTGRNVGLLNWYGITERRRTFEMQGRIMHELFYIAQFMLPEVVIKNTIVQKESLILPHVC